VDVTARAALGQGETNDVAASPEIERAAARPLRHLDRHARIAVVAQLLARYEFSREYVERLVAGEPDTQQHFAGYFKDLLTLKLRSRLRSKAEVDDAVQETFARVLSALGRGGLRTPGALGAFVTSVCTNVLYERYRVDSKTTALEEGHDRPDDRTPSAEMTILASQDRARVREALAALLQKEQDLLRWLFFEGRGKDEICRELNIDRNYLRVLLHRAKIRFRDGLRKLSG
jgi:RNA polymerase sigma-70 factor (ECF subfamily)